MIVNVIWDKSVFPKEELEFYGINEGFQPQQETFRFQFTVASSTNGMFDIVTLKRDSETVYFNFERGKMPLTMNLLFPHPSMTPDLSLMRNMIDGYVYRSDRFVAHPTATTLYFRPDVGMCKGENPQLAMMDIVLRCKRAREFLSVFTTRYFGNDHDLAILKYGSFEHIIKMRKGERVLPPCAVFRCSVMPVGSMLNLIVLRLVMQWAATGFAKDFRSLFLVNKSRNVVARFSLVM